VIRFVCRHCNKPVRIPDAFAGKSGRCPFCKQVIQIPATSEPEQQASEAPAAATPAEEEAPAPPAPEAPAPAEEEEGKPPPPAEPSDEAEKPEEETQVAEALEGLEQAPAPQTPPAKTAPSGRPARKAPSKPLLIGVAVGLLALVGVVLAILQPWAGPESAWDSRAAPSEQQAAAGPSQATQPESPTPPEPGRVFDLAPELLDAARRAPARTFAVFYLDLERTAPALAGAPAPTGELPSAVAGRRLWSDAQRRIAQGRLPRSVTLYLTVNSEPIAVMFGDLHGAHSGPGPADPARGLWTLTRPEAPVPHFLLSLTGPAAKNYATALLNTATRMGLAGTFDPGGVASHARLRMVGPEGAGETQEILIGTAETIDETGRIITAPGLHERLSEYLQKVPTGRPVVGCVRLDAARDGLGAAAGIETAPPAWAGDSTVLVFSIDPAGDGEADLVLAGAKLAALPELRSLVAPVTVAAEGDDARITGTGVDGIAALAKLLPGFEEIAIKALALCDEQAEPGTVPPQVPTPAETTAEQTGPSMPAPKPETAAATSPATMPKPVEPVTFVCLNSSCPTAGKTFTVPRDQVSVDVLAGTDVLVCPRCGKKTAVVAVKCPKCGQWYAQTLEACPNCKASGE